MGLGAVFSAPETTKQGNSTSKISSRFKIKRLECQTSADGRNEWHQKSIAKRLVFWPTIAIKNNMAREMNCALHPIL